MNDLKLLLNALSDRTVAYNAVYARITNSVTAGILLAQILYWWRRIL
jgi:hypothetical protein